MTSSGTTAFAPSNGEIVLAAYERIQIRAPSIRQEHMLTARREVNFLFSSWSNKTPNLWKVDLASQLLTAGTAAYSVDPSVVMILDAYISLNQGQTDQTDRFVTPISRTDYASYASKSTEGPPTVYWFDRLRSPTVTLWPVPDSSTTYYFNYYVCAQIQDANLAGGETPDVPYRFLDAMVADVAHRCARVYKPELEMQRKADAKEAWDIAASQDVENVPVKISPNFSGYYR